MKISTSKNYLEGFVKKGKIIRNKNLTFKRIFPSKILNQTNFSAEIGKQRKFSGRNLPEFYKETFSKDFGNSYSGKQFDSFNRKI